MAKTFSIIIPVYNDSEDLKLVLEAIKRQDFPAENFETFVVDNGSSDESIEVAKSFGFVDVLLEHEHLYSPYSCRNRGIEKSNGDIIVLLDASCKPVESWLQAAQECFNKTDADILGGDVKFDFKEKETAAKIYDSITNIRMKYSIEVKNVAKTANLFIKQKVFNDIGKFPEGLRSGGDVRWTAKAGQNGYKLKFCRNASVYKTARGYFALLKKQWRVGTHKPKILAEKGVNIKRSKLLLNALIPVSFKKVKYLLNESNRNNDLILLFSIWFVAQSVRTVMSVAQFSGSLRELN